MNRLKSFSQTVVKPYYQKFWLWTTQNRSHWRTDWKEGIVLFTIFGVTGSSSLLIVRPALKNIFGLQGTLRDGPNSYRVASILLVSPVYATTLLAIGTLSGRHNFFAKMSTKIIGRFMPKKILIKAVCLPAQQKWK